MIRALLAHPSGSFYFPWDWIELLCKFAGDLRHRCTSWCIVASLNAFEFTGVSGFCSYLSEPARGTIQTWHESELEVDEGPIAKRHEGDGDGCKGTVCHGKTVGSEAFDQFLRAEAV